MQDTTSREDLLCSWKQDLMFSFYFCRNCYWVRQDYWIPIKNKIIKMWPSVIKRALFIYFSISPENPPKYKECAISAGHITNTWESREKKRQTLQLISYSEAFFYNQVWVLLNCFFFIAFQYFSRLYFFPLIQKTFSVWNNF